MSYTIRNLGVISDRRTAAIIDKRGDICWYCPGQFDGTSLFASLLDEQNGGVWSINPGKSYATERKYVENSSILETKFQSGKDEFFVTDWMPFQEDFTGIIRSFSNSPVSKKNILVPAPGYGKEKVKIKKINDLTISINEKI